MHANKQIRLIYKSKHIEIEKYPFTFSRICTIIRTHFHISDPLLLIKDFTGYYQVSCSSEFSKIHSKNVVQIEVKNSFSLSSEMHMINFNKMDSIDTCTSHEKTDSEDESKKSEFAKSEEIYSDRCISECTGPNKEMIETETQTDKIELENKETFKENEAKHDFSSNFNCEVLIDLEKIKEIMRQEITNAKENIRKNVGFVHKDTTCKLCRKSPIIGARFECAICKYSLCENCEEEKKHEHELYKFKCQSKQVQETISKRESVVKKIVSLGFSDVQSVENIAKLCNYSLNDSLEHLLLR